MKKERNSRKELLDLYFYFDYRYGEYDENTNQSIEDKFNKLSEKYEQKFGYKNPVSWREYYGLFKLNNNRIGIDPKRYNKIIKLDENQYNVMKNRKTTYFHPKKEKYSDYLVNGVVDEINSIIVDFNKLYKPIIDKTIDEIKKMNVVPGDYYNLQCGISSVAAAQAWANIENIMLNVTCQNKKFEMKNNFYAQFFHLMTSRIEAATIRMYSTINPNMKKFSRNLLYKNINTKKINNEKLNSFKYHDELYCIWNFIKHNNLSTYKSLANDYKEVLIDKEYKPGDLAIRYVKLNEKLILDLLNGTKQYFIEWCEANCDEVYEEAQWNYTDYFLKTVDKEIEDNDNPEGLSWCDEID